MPTDEQYREAARRACADAEADGHRLGLWFNDAAEVKVQVGVFTGPGAWVEAWVWVPAEAAAVERQSGQAP